MRTDGLTTDADEFDRSLYLVFPAMCAFCGKLLEDGRICPECRKKLLPRADVTVDVAYADAAYAPYRYTVILREAVHRYKFQGKTEYRALFGDMIAACLTDHLREDVELVTWVPVNVVRRLKRGYDQSMLLANRVSRDLHLPCRRLLVKQRNTPPQYLKKDEQERRANVKGAFRMKKRTDVAGKTVLLIDDLCTSGATLAECCRVLLKAGAKGVVCACLAKAGK